MNTTNQLLTDIKGGRIAPIYFLMGEEAYYIDVISDYIESHVLAEEEKGFNQMVTLWKRVHCSRYCFQCQAVSDDG